jgi:hypothetical protein
MAAHAVHYLHWMCPMSKIQKGYPTREITRASGHRGDGKPWRKLTAKRLQVRHVDYLVSRAFLRIEIWLLKAIS